MLHFPNFFSKSWFSSDVSSFHEIYCFGKCFTILWDGGTSLGNHLLEKKIGKCSIYLFVFMWTTSIQHLVIPMFIFDTLTCSDISIKYGSQDGCFIVASVHIKLVMMSDGYSNVSRIICLLKTLGLN